MEVNVRLKAIKQLHHYLTHKAPKWDFACDESSTITLTKGKTKVTQRGKDISVFFKGKEIPLNPMEKELLRSAIRQCIKYHSNELEQLYMECEGLHV